MGNHLSTMLLVQCAACMIAASNTATGQSLRLQNSSASLSSQVRIKSPPGSIASLMPQHLTVELWIKPLGPGYGHTDDAFGADIAYRGDDIVPAGLTVASWVIRWEPTTMKVNFNLDNGNPNGPVWHSSGTVPVGTKAHVAITFDGQRAKLYLNGVKDVDEPWGSNIYYEVDDAVWIGTGNGVLTDPNAFIRRFDGVVDSMRIWDHARTNEEIVASMQCDSIDPGDGLRGAWTFDDLTAGLVHDTSGFGNDGVLGGSGWSTAPDFADLKDCAMAWSDRGFAKAGSNGLPQLVGSGPLSAGSSNTLVLTKAVAASTATLVVGLTELDAPFKGGTLVPSVLTLLPSPTGPIGTVLLPFILPPSTPASVNLYFQYWISDAGAIQGFSASNGVQGSTH